MYHERIIEYLRHKYPKGTRVELLKMDDRQAPPLGTMGTVECVDDMATVHIHWDNGSTLGAVHGEDIIKVVEKDERIN